VEKKGQAKDLVTEGDNIPAAFNILLCPQQYALPRVRTHHARRLTDTGSVEMTTQQQSSRCARIGGRQQRRHAALAGLLPVALHGTPCILIADHLVQPANKRVKSPE
jgi:hypothetical protein